MSVRAHQVSAEPPAGDLPGEVVDVLSRQVDHREAECALRQAGWTPCGAGDWAIALRSPDGTMAARISPFDPTGPYTAALYRQAAYTRQVPVLFAHARLVGGGDLQVMEWLREVPEDEAGAFHRAIAARAPQVADLVDVVWRVHDQARRELPWCGPLDHNPANVMRATDGRLVVADLFYADGPNLYATAATDPDLLVARIPEHERRFLTEIPLAASGPWKPEEREAVRAGLAAADARRGAEDRGDHVTTGLLIRPAIASDLDSLGPLAGSRDRAEVRLQAAERGDESMAVAVLSSRIVGLESIRWSNGCDPPNPWLYGLHVAPEVQRQGIGRALVRAAEDLGRRRGAYRMTLDVDVEDARAIAFYEALGYVVVRPHQHRWRSIDPRSGAVTKEGTAPTLIMECVLR